ncbi:MAG: hypothetical protein GXZ07_02950 [Firmicutes bacterium]|nr:hypothetical protein [Bacillota bacterium]
MSWTRRECILICLAVELDRKYEKLYSFLQDDVTCKLPTVGLILDLLCPMPEDKLAFRYYFGAGQKLCRYFLKGASFINRSGSLLSRTMQLDERVVEFLLHGSKSNNFLPFYTLINPDQELPPLLLEEAAQKKLRDFNIFPECIGALLLSIEQFILCFLSIFQYFSAVGQPRKLS